MIEVLEFKVVRAVLETEVIEDKSITGDLKRKEVLPVEGRSKSLLIDVVAELKKRIADLIAKRSTAQFDD